MFARRHRLSRPEFSLVSRDTSAKRAASPHFSVVLSRNAAGAAVVVSKKVAKTAVGRHLLKRRVRAALQPWVSSEYALIVFAREGSDAIVFSELAGELETLLQRVIPAHLPTDA
jgi:ribonuclease P protein component